MLCCISPFLAHCVLCNAMRIVGFLQLQLCCVVFLLSSALCVVYCILCNFLLFSVHSSSDVLQTCLVLKDFVIF